MKAVKTLGYQEAKEELEAILEINKAQILEEIGWSALVPEQQIEPIKQLMLIFAPILKQYILEHGISLGELYNMFQDNPHLSEDPEYLELFIINHTLSKADIPDTEKLIEFAVHHQRFTKEIVMQFFEEANFKEANLILLSLGEDVRATLFKDFVAGFGMHPYQEDAENAKAYEALVDSVCRIYNNPEQRLEYLKTSTSICNIYAVRKISDLLLSEQPEFFQDHMSELIALLPGGFRDAIDLRAFYVSIKDMLRTTAEEQSAIASQILDEVLAEEITDIATNEVALLAEENATTVTLN
jgi:hypothetical protein